MATVELSFSALPAHVRTARLVATAVARRSGVDEAVLDEVRLAVGEACSRAVDLHRRHCPQKRVRVVLSDDRDAFRVQVSDCGPVEDVPGTEERDPLGALADSAGAGGAGPDATDDSDPLPSGVGIAVISGLVDDVTVESLANGTAVRMSWPAGPSA